MSHWNYRIMKRLNELQEYEFGIYEVYYNDSGDIDGWTEDSLVPICSSEAHLLHELEMMKEAFTKETLLYLET